MKKQVGFSLIEVLIALTILAFGAIILIGFQSDALRTAGIADQQSIAFQLGQKKLNELRSYSVVNSTAGYTAYEDIINGSESVTTNNTSYTITWVVTENTSPDYKYVQVTVSWTDALNQSQQVELQGYVGKVETSRSGIYVESL